MNLLTAVAFPRTHREPTPPGTGWTYISIGRNYHGVEVTTDNTTWAAASSYYPTQKFIYTTTNPAVSWTEQNFTNGLSTIHYANGVWVAANVDIWTASDPTSTWTLNGTLWDSSHSVASLCFGNNIWTAVGGSSSEQKCATATNPAGTWTNNTSGLSTGHAPFNTVATNGSIWARGGGDGRLHTASDPSSTWTARTIGITSNINCISYDGTYWVAVGESGELYTASNPTSTWTARTSGFGTTSINSIANNGGTKWVAVGDSGKLFSASDPTGTWTQENSGFGTAPIYSVAYGNGTWVACGQYGISTRTY